MTLKIGSSFNNFYNAPVTDTVLKDGDVSVKNRNVSAVSQKPKLPPVSGSVTFTALGADTEMKLAKAGYMAAAAKAGIADGNARREFADAMIAGKTPELTLTNSKNGIKTDLDDTKVKARVLNQSVKFILQPNDIKALEKFRAGYAAGGGKIRFAKNPTIDMRQPGTANGVTNLQPKSTPNIKARVLLDGQDNPTDGTRILTKFAEDQYKSGNLYGKNYLRIAEMSDGQGVKPKITKVTRVGDKYSVEFELTPLDRAKIHENYKIVQAQVNEIDKIVAQINRDNPVSQFILGAVNGFKDNLVGTAEMIAHPLETLNAIKEVAVALSNLSGDDIAKITKQLENKIKETVTTKDGINSIPYGAGYAAGVIAAEIVLGKGTGAALEALEGIGAIKKLLTTVKDFKEIAKVKIAAPFTDEAAAVAKQKFFQRAKELGFSPNNITNIMADPELWARASQIAGNAISKGYTKFTDFSKQITKELGEIAKPQLEKLYRESLISLDLSKGKQILSSGGKLIDEAVVREAKEKVIEFVQQNKVKELKDYLGEIGNKYGTEFEKELKSTVEKAVDNIFEGRRTPEVYDMLGGHTIYDLFDGKIDTKHIGKTVQQLRARLGKEPGIPFASTFKDLDTANRAQMQFIKHYEKEIEAWIKNGKVGTFERKLDIGQDLGTIVGRGKFGIQRGTKVFVVIAKDETAQGWHIVTSFPSK